MPCRHARQALAIAAALLCCVLLGGVRRGRFTLHWESPRFVLAEPRGPASAGDQQAASAAGQVQSTATKPPSVSVITVNLFEFEESSASRAGSPTMQEGLWWAEFLLVSRLYNPDLSFTAMVDQLDRVEASPAGKALREAGVRLAAIDAYQRPGSRGERLMREAGRFYQRYFSMFRSGLHGCDGASSVGTSYCRRVSSGRMRMLARFCWQADLANEQGSDYVLALDADAMLTAPLRESFGVHLNKSVDVLTFIEWSSQAVLFKREVLNDFCDAQIRMLDMLDTDEQSLWYIFHAGQGGTTDSEWTDMHMLQAYLRVMRPDLSRTILCGTPSDDSEELCRNLAWKVAQAASFMPARSDSDPRRDHCERLGKYVTWRVGSASRGGSPTLPEVWTRHTYLDIPTEEQQRSGVLKPRMHGPPQRVPLIHWQGVDGCKRVGSKYVREYYTERGLIPELA